MELNKGWAIWITGLPGSGKSTIANALLKKLQEYNNRLKVQILRTDELRKIMTPKPTYSEEERSKVYGVFVFIGKLLVQNDINVIFDATANRRKYRNWAREKIDKFMEVFIDCPIDVCIEREAKRENTILAPKDIYKKALEGWPVPGWSVPYEKPLKPEVVVKSDELSAEDCAKIILKKMIEYFVFDLSFLR